MNPISNLYRSRATTNLESKHYLAIQLFADWQEVWDLFYDNSWFRKKLFYSSLIAARCAGLHRDCVDDIQQEALIEFSKSLQRDPSLGFDSQLGDFKAFMTTVIKRCCQKGLRQFRVRHTLSIDEECLHPSYDDQSRLEKVIDFRQMARRIPEPYRGTVKLVCDGFTIEQIAKKRKRSKRTIYRWIDRSVELLQDLCFDEFDE